MRYERDTGNAAVFAGPAYRRCARCIVGERGTRSERDVLGGPAARRGANDPDRRGRRDRLVWSRILRRRALCSADSGGKGIAHGGAWHGDEPADAVCALPPSAPG